MAMVGEGPKSKGYVIIRNNKGYVIIRNIN